MGFLFPLYLLGLAGLAVPLFLHLRRKPPKDVQDFPSLMLLRASPEERKTKRQLEDILLLLLRCLALAALVFAFCRPFFGSGDGEGSGLRRNLVLLLDRSASMQREGLWDEAREKALKLTGDLDSQDRLTVLGFDGKTEVLLAPEEPADAFAGRLADLEPGWGATDLGAALLAALGHAQDDDPGPDADPDELASGSWKHEVVVLGDLQSGSDLDGLNGLAWPEAVELKFERIGAARGPETNVSVQPMPLGDDGQPRLVVRNSPGAERENFDLVWADGSAAGKAYVPAGFTRVVRLEPPAAPAFAVALTGDDAAFDNAAAFAPAKPRPIAIHFIGDPAQLEDPEKAGYYLKRAFRPTPTLNPRIAASPPSAEAAEDAFAVVVGNAEGLDEFLAAGGHALVLASPATTPLLARHGITDAGVRSPERYAILGELDFEHPILAPFSDARLRDFSKIRTWKHRRLELSEKAAASARILARFDSGDPAWIDLPASTVAESGDLRTVAEGGDLRTVAEGGDLRGGGRLLVLASSWAPEESQLALSTKFVPLLYGALGWAGIDAGEGLRLEVGDRVEVGPGWITDAAGKEVAFLEEEDAVFVPERPGLYKFVTSQGESDPVFYAVNLAPEEGNTAPLPRENLIALGLLADSDVSTAADPTADSAEEEEPERPGFAIESSQRSWRWWFIAALAFLLLETLLGMRRGRAEEVAG